MRQLICLAAVLSLASFANAELKIKPQVPTPRPLIREAFMPGNEVLLSFPMDLALRESGRGIGSTTNANSPTWKSAMPKGKN